MSGEQRLAHRVQAQQFDEATRGEADLVLETLFQGALGDAEFGAAVLLAAVTGRE